MRISTSIAAVAWTVLVVAVACGGDDDNDNQGGTGGGVTGGSGGATGGAGGTSGGSGGETGGSGGATGGSGGATGGSGGATGGSGGSSTECATVCARIASAGCDEEEEEAACTLDCEKGNAELAAECGAPLDALMACMVTAPVSCDEDGFAEFEGCDSQMEALGACAMCVPMSQDDACEVCEKEKCCSEMKALASDPNAEAYLECLLACDNPSCPDACDAAFSSTLALMEAYAGCTGTNCASVCD